MIYTDLTKKALLISFNAHKDQVDKSNLPYVYHPFHVAEQMTDETSTIVALLHDVVEDTDVTMTDIENYGFSKEIIDALKCMTHEESVDYYDYIKIVATNPIAIKVKLADIEHNMDTNRLNEITKKDLERVEKYKKCYKYLVEKQKEFK